ncbi:zonadhesin [Lingula anatina]|uniref:Zonadhesin n=1 Tax=Lingula anatina TaxID=7574 RepID=A0A1S3H1H4_LINAN|nr:zonadhesin [Lingula anatina]|eukprot:XP_013379331.1 zonadhesin [Lingula anatina]
MNTFTLVVGMCALVLVAGHHNKPHECFIRGDPHYLQFDGYDALDFQGRCTYIVSETSNFNMNNPPTDSFRVLVSNSLLPNHDDLTFSTAVWVIVHGHTVRLDMERDVILLDDEIANIPHTESNFNVTHHHPGYVRLLTSFGLEVELQKLTNANRKHKVWVRVPASYNGQLRGICGNMDGNDDDDDFLTPEGTVENDVTVFGNSWKQSLGLVEPIECR